MWWYALIGFLLGIFPWIPYMHVRQYRWQLRMRVEYPLLYENSPPPPKWWQVRRVWNFDDGVRER